MKLISWNVNGIRAVVKKDFFEDIQKMNADILCLQETKAQDDEVAAALAPINTYKTHFNSATQKGYSGTSILSKENPKNITANMGIDEHDTEGRILCAEYDNFFFS